MSANRPHVEFPEGWHVSGELPERVDLSEAKLTSLQEDMFQVRTPNDEFTIDVGWTPEADRTGGFVCVVIHAANWDTPIDELRTSDVDDVHQWLVSAIDLVQRRRGGDAVSVALAAMTLPPIQQFAPLPQGGVPLDVKRERTNLGNSVNVAAENPEKSVTFAP